MALPMLWRRRGFHPYRPYSGGNALIATRVRPRPGRWIQRGGFKNAAGELCCGERDCFELTDADVKITSAGYYVVSIKETIPFSEATPSPDRHATGAANGAARASASSRRRAQPDRLTAAQQRAADVSSEFRLQAAHERGQAGLSFALEPLGAKDRAHVAECAIEVAVDHDIIVFGPMAHLVAGLGHAGADHLLVVLARGCAAAAPVRRSTAAAGTR